MGVPNSLEEWTLDAVKELLNKGVFESDWFDFKVELPHTMSEKIAPSLEWEPRPEPIKIPETGRLIHVIWIKRSWRKPHAILHDVQFVFPKRTHKGNEDMNYAEVKHAFQDTEAKRAKLMVVITELSKFMEVADRILFKVPAGDPQPGPPFEEAWTLRYSTALIDMTLGEVFNFITLKGNLWNAIRKLRMAADVSNSACDAFAHAVYAMGSSTTAMHRSHYELIRSRATEVKEHSFEATKLLMEILA